MAAKLTIISWRDIPAQVIAKKRRESAKIPLSDRFHEAVDRAAMRAGKASSDAYLEDWKHEQRACSDDLEAEAQAVAKKLEEEYSDAYLEKLIKAKGIAADVKVDA